MCMDFIVRGVIPYIAKQQVWHIDAYDDNEKCRNDPAPETLAIPSRCLKESDNRENRYQEDYNQEMINMSPRSGDRGGRRENEEVDPRPGEVGRERS